MIDRIDRDGNEELSREELILQLELVDRAYFQQDLEQQWPQVDLDGDDYITRQEYDESMGKGGWWRERGKSVVGCCNIAFSAVEPL